MPSISLINHTLSRLVTIVVFFACVFFNDNIQANEPFADTDTKNILRHVYLNNDSSKGNLRHAQIKRAIATAVGNALGRHVTHHGCPFSRCIADLKSGDADIIIAIYAAKKREQFLEYFQLMENVRKMPFYVRTGEEQILSQYEDFYDLAVGVVSGYAYFDPFDLDTKINKHIVNSETQLPKLLLANRIDAFNSYLPDILKTYPEISRATYQPNQPSIALVSVSRQSPHFEYLTNYLPLVIKQLLSDGQLEEICKTHGPCFSALQNLYLQQKAVTK